MGENRLQAGFLQGLNSRSTQMHDSSWGYRVAGLSRSRPQTSTSVSAHHCRGSSCTRSVSMTKVVFRGTKS